MKRLLMMTGIAAALSTTLFSTANAGRADDAIQACRVAIQSEQGDDAIAKLTKIKSRGTAYEVWFNVDAQEDVKSWCFMKRGEVQQLVTTDGKWKGRNPKRPEGIDLSS